MEDLPPVRLGELRKANVPLAVSCPLCSHRANVDPIRVRGPDSLDIKELTSRFRCQKCLRHGGMSVTAETKPWVWHLRRTRQFFRIPAMARMIRDEGEDEQA